MYIYLCIVKLDFVNKIDRYKWLMGRKVFKKFQFIGYKFI